MARRVDTASTMNHQRLSSMLFPLAAALALSCAQAPLSADAHRERAEVETARAAEHAARYDEDAVAVRVQPSVDGDESVEIFNPTHFEKVGAEVHGARARRHEAAALALEQSEVLACKGVPPAARAACPLLLTVTVDDVFGGVRVTFDDESAAGRAADVVRCQQAFALTRGFADLPACALYGRGLQVHQKGSVLELTARDAGDVARLRDNVRAHHPKP